MIKKRIHKYQLDKVNEWFGIMIPKDHTILSVGVKEPLSEKLQAELANVYTNAQRLTAEAQMFAWVMVDPLSPLVKREFILVGTGIDFPQLRMTGGEKFIGTLQNGIFVWHVFSKEVV